MSSCRHTAWNPLVLLSQQLKLQRKQVFPELPTWFFNLWHWILTRTFITTWCLYPRKMDTELCVFHVKYSCTLDLMLSVIVIKAQFLDGLCQDPCLGSSPTILLSLTDFFFLPHTQWNTHTNSELFQNKQLSRKHCFVFSQWFPPLRLYLLTSLFWLHTSIK